MEVRDELFWGYDDFLYLELFLAGRDPLDPQESRTWLTVLHGKSARQLSRFVRRSRRAEILPTAAFQEETLDRLRAL